MSGKENFKAVRNSHLDNIMTEYGVDKDTAYKALATALDDARVLNAVSKALADQFGKEEKEISVNPFEEWANQFLTRANKRY